jgi:hypothetical protein
MSMTTAGGDGPGQAPAHVLDLFDSGSSVSDSEADAPVPCRKCPRKSPLPKAIPKTSDGPDVKGAFTEF